MSRSARGAHVHAAPTGTSTSASTCSRSTTRAPRATASSPSATASSRPTRASTAPLVRNVEVTRARQRHAGRDSSSRCSRAPSVEDNRTVVIEGNATTGADRTSCSSGWPRRPRSAPSSVRARARRRRATQAISISSRRHAATTRPTRTLTFTAADWDKPVRLVVTPRDNDAAPGPAHGRDRVRAARAPTTPPTCSRARTRRPRGSRSTCRRRDRRRRRARERRQHARRPRRRDRRRRSCA